MFIKAEWDFPRVFYGVHAFYTYEGELNWCMHKRTRHRDVFFPWQSAKARPVKLRISWNESGVTNVQKPKLKTVHPALQEEGCWGFLCVVQLLSQARLFCDLMDHSTHQTPPSPGVCPNSRSLNRRDYLTDKERESQGTRFQWSCEIKANQDNHTQ